MYANCTKQAQGVTPAIADERIDVQVGKTVTVNTADYVPEEYEDKDLVYSLNYRVLLPEGISFDNGVLSGKFKHAGLFRVDVIGEYEDATGKTKAVAFKFAFHVTPNMNNTGLTAPVNGALVVGLSVGGGVLVIAAAAVVVVLLLKKKKTA